MTPHEGLRVGGEPSVRTEPITRLRPLAGAGTSAPGSLPSGRRSARPPALSAMVTVAPVGTPAVPAQEAAVRSLLEGEGNADAIRYEGGPGMRERPIRTFVDCLIEAAGVPAGVPLSRQLTGDHLTPQWEPDSDDARPFVASVETWGWPPVLADLGRGKLS